MIVLSLTFIVVTKALVRELFVRAGGIGPVDLALSFINTVMHTKSTKLSTTQATETRSME
jgi:hypothetical protein